MNKFTKPFCMVCCILLMTGCWDQRLYKNAKLVLTMGIDITEKRKILTTVSIPSVENTAQGPGKETVQTVSGPGKTPRESREVINRKIAGDFDPSKLNVLVLGEDVVKQKIYPVLDVFYRNPKSNLNADLAITTGAAKDVISFKAANEPRISEYLGGLLESARHATMVPRQNIQLICAEMFDPGQDFMLPLLEVNNEESVVELKGLAMFSGQIYSGEFLTPYESTMYLLMSGQQGKIARITERVSQGRKPELLNYITIEVNDVDRHFKIKTPAGGSVTVDIELNFAVQAVEYPKDKLDTKKEIEKLNKILSKELTKDSQAIIKKMQDANCDALGIGRKLIAFHHETWEQLDWKKEYPNIDINTEVNVDIVQHGILN